MQLKVYVDGSNQIETGTILQKVLRIMEKAKAKKKNPMMLQMIQLTHKTDSQFQEMMMMMSMIDMVAEEALVVVLHRAQEQLRDERPQGAKKHQGRNLLDGHF